MLFNVVLQDIDVVLPNCSIKLKYVEFITHSAVSVTELCLLERPTLASRVPLFLLGHFLTNECEISDFCL